MKAPEISSSYCEADFDLLGFHDCYLHGIRWHPSEFAFVLYLDYIVQWVEPPSQKDSFRLWICKAELRFVNVDETRMVLDWGAWAPECQIDALNRTETRTTPSGRKQWLWELEMSIPDGEIIFWATGFQLKILGPPVLSDVQYLRR